MIYVDFSYLIISCYFAQEKEIGEVTENDFRKHILHALFSINSRHKHEFGKMVLCCEGRNSWRYKTFPHYKILRKVSRAEDALKWKEIDRLTRTIKSEIVEHNVFCMLGVEGAEGDDVIAVLCETYKEPTLIISEDKDFHQLHRLSHVKQYSKRRDAIYKSADPLHDLKEKIIRGDRNDSIPNIHSKDDVFVIKERQTVVSAKAFEKYSKTFLICDDGIPEAYRSNFQRNQTLIDFRFIPSHIRDAILNEMQKPSSASILSGGKRTQYLLKSGLNPNSF